MTRTCVFPMTAYGQLVHACHAQAGIETGGALVGWHVDGRFIIPFVLRAGPRAKGTAVSFEPDCAAQQPILDFLFARFGADYVGDFHSHPVTYPLPSSRDWSTAIEIVTSQDWNTPHAVFPIAVVKGSRVHVRAFALSCGQDDFREIPIEIVPDHHPLIVEFLISKPKEVRNNGADTAHRRRGSSAGGSLVRRVAARLRVRA